MLKAFLTEGSQAGKNTPATGAHGVHIGGPEPASGRNASDSTHSSRRLSQVAPPSDTDPPPGGGGLRSLAMFKQKRTLKGLATRLTTIFSLRRAMGGKPSEPRPVKLENTYKMSPDKQIDPKVAAMEHAMEEVLQSELHGLKYDQDMCKELVKELSDLVKQRIKDLGYRRHKLVCNVLVGQTCDQGIELASRGLWDPRCDSWACVSYKNDSLFAVAMVHACYVE